MRPPTVYEMAEYAVALRRHGIRWSKGVDEIWRCAITTFDINSDAFVATLDRLCQHNGKTPAQFARMMSGNRLYSPQAIWFL